MPCLFALGQHEALQQARHHLHPSDALYAFLDDIYVTGHPDRTADQFRILQDSLRQHANIQVHLGKTRAWNSAGEEPPGLLDMLPPEDAANPCWTGSWTLPAEKRGVVVLGSPFFFSRAFLRLHCGNPVEGMGEPYAEAAVGRRLQRPGWEATGQDGEFPTGVGQQLRQVRHGFIAVDFSCKWELKQGGRVCPLGCDCEQCRPSRDPGRLCSRPEVGRHGGCPLPGEQAQEACSLVAKASAYLNADMAAVNSSKPNCSSAWRTKTAYYSGSRWSPTYSARGCCYCSAGRRAARTCSGPSPQQTQQPSPRGTMLQSSAAWRGCWRGAKPGRRSQPRVLGAPSSPCAWGGLGWGLRSRNVTPHTGRPGRTRCGRSALTTRARSQT